MIQNRSSYIDAMVYDELKSVVGEDHITTKATDKFVYGIDHHWTVNMWVDRGKYPLMADYIVHPGNNAEISKILQIANHRRIPVVPWGGGAGGQGGALAIAGGIIIDVKRLDKVLDLDKESLVVTAETGIIQHDLEESLNQKGYSMMHYPASIHCSTLAGFLAHRGSGVLSTKYGKIEDMVVSMEVVLPNGDIIDTLPVPRHAAGPDLNQLFVGSEGTLGIFTKAAMKVRRIPEKRSFRAFIFKDLHEALEVGKEIMVGDLRPCVIRVYDEEETRSRIKRVLGIERKGSYIVVGFDGRQELVDLEQKLATRACIEKGAEDLGSELGERWWNHKYDFYFPPYTHTLPKLSAVPDVVCLYKDVESVYRNMKKVIESNFPNIHFMCHFSHWYDWGCMIYPQLVLDQTPKDPLEAIKLYNRIWDLAVEAALTGGAVINDHHGVGFKLSRFMRSQYGRAFDVLEQIKKTLDPNNIMNPGKLGF